MWRPPNWENPYKYKGIISQMPIENLLTGYVRGVEENIYEAGADAILNSLKACAIDPHSIRTYEFDPNNPLRIRLDECFGFIVFIPEE